METTRMQIKGLVRNKGLNEFADGDCQEIINMRYRDNAWRPIIDPQFIKVGAFDNTYRAIWLHVQDNVRNYIAWDTAGRLVMLNSNTWAETLIKDYGTAEIDVKFLKRFMLVISQDGIDKWIWKHLESVYYLANIVNPPLLTMKTGSAMGANIRTETATTAEALLGKYRKLLIEINQQDGMLEGGIMWRIAYKLYDGSYVLHTLPEYLRIAALGSEIQKVGSEYRINFWADYIYAEIDRVYYQTFAGLKDIISSIAIFACKNERLHTVDEFTITDSLLEGVTAITTFASIPLPINNDFPKMADPKSWYKVHEIAFVQAIDPNVGTTEAIDMKGFVRDYAARETMPVDSFSHHRLTANSSFIYNDRLILGDTITHLGDYDIDTQFIFSKALSFSGRRQDYVFASFKESYLLVSLSTDNGVVYKLIQVMGGYATKGGKLYIIFLTPVIGYPDARATEIKLLTKENNTWYITAEMPLTKSLHDNYSYYHTRDFDAALPFSDDKNYNLIIKEVVFNAEKIINIEVYATKPLTDNNRVQLSELRNPYFFPVKNSYQVGTGKVLAMGANTEPLSTGQFGQFPLSVFTSKGIWALEQGQGDVIFAAISPLSGDVILNKDQVVSVGNGVVFTTNRGVFAISGKQLAQISEALEGPVFADFTANDHFQNFIDSTNLVALLPYISADDALTYISGAKAGFDKVNNELYFTRPGYFYSYVFNFESNTWHKISRVYDLLINDYPDLLGVNTAGLYNLSLQSGATYQSMLIVTQAQSLTMNEVFKKIERLALRCTVNADTGKYFTLVVFASNDLKTWQIITGGQLTGYIKNILLTRSHCSAQYYIIMLSGKIRNDSNFTSVDVSFSPRLNNKLRR